MLYNTDKVEGSGVFIMCYMALGGVLYQVVCEERGLRVLDIYNVHKLCTPRLGEEYCQR